MDRVTRRNLLACSGLSMLLGSEAAARESEIEKAIEPFVVGPYNMSDWLKRSKLKFGNIAVHLGDGAREAMIKSFRGCQAYVIDQRVQREQGGHKFIKTDPCVAFSGQLHHEWEHQGKQLVVEISRAQLSAQKTDNEKALPTREFCVTVELHTAETDGRNSSRSTTVFTTEPLSYNIKGS